MQAQTKVFRRGDRECGHSAFQPDLSQTYAEPWELWASQPWYCGHYNWIIHCCRTVLKFTSIPGCYPSDASISSPVATTKNVSRVTFSAQGESHSYRNSNPIGGTLIWQLPYGLGLTQVPPSIPEGSIHSQQPNFQPLRLPGCTPALKHASLVLLGD